MANAYGIDLGTTYSAIAKLGATGAPEIIEDASTGNGTLASAVYFNEEGEVAVGETAKEEGVAAPERLKQFFKRWIGLNDNPNREHYMLDGQEYDPIQLSAMVLGKIVEYARESGEDVHDVVITCPAYFDYAQRDATRQAGVTAGLNVLAIINEPTAAAINYCYNRFNEDQTVLVYDLGGGTFDVTLMRMTEHDGQRNVDVLGTDGDAFLGGYEWDQALFEILCSKYEENYGVPVDDIPEDLKIEIRSRVEKLKMDLSKKEKAKIKIPYEGENVQLEVTREEFEAATRGYVDQTIGWMDSVLQKAGCSDSDVDVVLMVGGSTKMPMIRGMLEQRFGDKAFFGDPDKAVAKGAAIVAEMKKAGEMSGFIDELSKQLSDGSVRLEKGRDGKLQVVDAVTGQVVEEATENFQQVIEDLAPEQLEPADGEGDQPFDPSQLVSSVQEQLERDGNGGVNIGDVAARTFGIIARRPDGNGGYELIVDNIVHQGEKTPCSYERTYYTPSDNVERLRFPVVQSVSEAEADVIDMDGATGEFLFPVSDMKTCNELLLPVPSGLARGSEILVEFRLDDLGNVYLKATEPVSGHSEFIEFRFNEISQDKLDEFRAVQEGVTYALED